MKKASKAASAAPSSAPPEGRRKYDPEETKRNILDIATQEFSAMGLTGARVDAIAERTNTTKRMLYYYFGSKEGLYEAVLEQVYGDIRALEQELQLAEMLFYAQMRNSEIARVLGVEDGYVALRKHRWIKQLRAELVGAADDTHASEDDATHASLLSEVWEEHRPSCPKRSTLGGYLLGTLDESWTTYVKFHVERLGCRFCAANLDDLRRETTEAAGTVRDRVMQSTVGFFRRA